MRPEHEEPAGTAKRVSGFPGTLLRPGADSPWRRCRRLEASPALSSAHMAHVGGDIQGKHCSQAGTRSRKPRPNLWAAALRPAKDKGQSAEGPWAQSGPRAGSQTHLAVLRDLHLLPLRHLGDVEVALWDPQKRRHQEASEETRNALRNVCS